MRGHLEKFSRRRSTLNPRWNVALDYALKSRKMAAHEKLVES